MRHVIATIVIVLGLGWGLPGHAQDLPGRISVSGEGRVEAVPDMATVRLGVTTQAPGAREAIDDNSRAMAAVLDRLAGLGVAERDIQTQGFSVSPRWENRSNAPARIAGFVAQNRVAIRVRDLDALGGILDAVARDGANSFDGLSFGLQEPGPVQDAARRAAVADARARAALYAEAAGVELGRLLSLGDVGAGPQPGPMPMARAEMAMVSDAVPMAAGELSITAQVLMVFEIAE
ncbi:MAG: SIMPL domain-containing protein [Alphaproteobacteria bacterium]|nr:SIMPL domain-containing protein [Alphaproteobacteria bacterium]NNF71113.1 SIMPL domain-containing protein [Paracoccaceae bacterium]